MDLRQRHLRLAPCALALSALAVAACTTSLAPDAGEAGDAGADAGTADLGADAGSDLGAPDMPLPEYLPTAEPGRHTVEILDTRQIVPSDGLPPETPAQDSNNNLDVIRFGGRVYLAWRSAPTHFASPETRMHVVSSDDEVHWTWETSFSMSTDLRECRFLAIGSSLFLYVARLGATKATFTPEGFSVAERRPDGTWTSLDPVYDPGYIAWRAKTERGISFVVAYLGGEHIYDFTGLPLQIELLTTTDGRTLVPFDSTHAVISMGGGSETDFTIGDDGSLFGIIRNEEGDDAFRFGSKVCHAAPGHLAEWTCVADPKKYDSPLMFWYDGEAYLIGRRNVSPTGNYDLMTRTDEALPTQEAVYLVDYSGKRKRCALWRYVQGEDRIAFVTDLPSRGDTCFAAKIDGAAPNELVVYNYSSPLDGPDVNWHTGQDGTTRIYRHVLRFTPRP